MIEKRKIIEHVLVVLICFYLPIEAKIPKILRSGSLKMSLMGEVLWPKSSDQDAAYITVEMEDQWAISGLERVTWQWENSLQLGRKKNESPFSIENIQVENIKNTGTLFLSVTNNIDVGLGYCFGQNKLTDFSNATIKPQLVVIARW